jgi:hypothetical protein
MKTFVTGGTGFIGRRTVKHLVEAGHEVCCLFRSPSAVPQLEQLGVRAVPGELARKATLPTAKGCTDYRHRRCLYVLGGRSAAARPSTSGTRNVMEPPWRPAAEVVRVVQSRQALSEPGDRTGRGAADTARPKQVPGRRNRGITQDEATARCGSSGGVSRPGSEGAGGIRTSSTAGCQPRCWPSFLRARWRVAAAMVGGGKPGNEGERYLLTAETCLRRINGLIAEIRRSQPGFTLLDSLVMEVQQPSRRCPASRRNRQCSGCGSIRWFMKNAR